MSEASTIPIDIENLKLTLKDFIIGVTIEIITEFNPSKYLNFLSNSKIKIQHDKK